MSTRINIVELEQAITKLLAHAKEQAGGDSVEVEQDCYWDVPLSSLYNMELSEEDISKQIGIGSLRDDWKSTVALLKNDAEPVALLLLKVAPLLCCLAENVQEGRPKATNPNASNARPEPPK